MSSFYTKFTCALIKYPLHVGPTACRVSAAFNNSAQYTAVYLIDDFLTA